jgi:hypothetical protein
VSFDITDVIIEIEVGNEIDDESTSYVKSFKHYQSGKDLDFGVTGSWLCDIEYEVTFPKEPGKYRMRADWNDSSEIIESIYDIVRLEERE